MGQRAERAWFSCLCRGLHHALFCRSLWPDYSSASSGQTIETLIPRSRRTGSRVLSPPSSPVRERVVKIASEYEANAHAHSSAAPVGLLDSGRRSFWAYFAVPVGLVVALGVLAGGWSYSHGDHLDLGWDASMARPVQPTSMINSSMPLFDSDGNVVLSARAVRQRFNTDRR